MTSWWLTDHHNCQFHLKLFSLWQSSQHAVCHCQESGKTATQLLQCLVSNLQHRPVRVGNRTRDVHSSSLLIDVYALFSDVSLRRQASMTQAEKFPDPFLLKSYVNLFNHLVRKADVAGCCSAGSVLRWHEVAPYSVSLICIVWSCFTLVDADQLIRYLRHNWLFDGVFDKLTHRCGYVDDNHYHFTGLFRWKRYQKTSSWVVNRQ